MQIVAHQGEEAADKDGSKEASEKTDERQQDQKLQTDELTSTRLYLDQNFMKCFEEAKCPNNLMKIKQIINCVYV